MRGWDDWVRRGSLASPGTALRAQNKGAYGSRTERPRNGSDQGTRVLGRGKRACGDREAGRNGGVDGWDRCARLGRVRRAQRCHGTGRRRGGGLATHLNGEHEQVVKPPREVADALFFNLKRVDEKAIRH